MGTRATTRTTTKKPAQPRGEKLLERLREGDSISAACKVQRIHRRTYYAWRDKYPDFAAAADDAIEAGTDLLEDVAKVRATAIDGSDTLLIFLLKSRRPDKYRERSSVEHKHVFDRAAAERMAEQYGLDVQEVIAEAERHLAEARSH